jgi:methyltransferase
VSAPAIIILLVAAQRLAEAIYAERNARTLLAAGATEAGRRHYPLFVLLHAGWIAALLLAVSPDAPVSWPLVTVYGVLQAGRAWVMVSLGRLWTTRVISTPGNPLVTRGRTGFFVIPTT